MSKIIWATAFFCMILTGGWAFSGEKKVSTRPEPPKSQGNVIVVSGKIFCYLKRQVIIPYHCIIRSLHTRSGQQVKKDEVLARYRLDPEAALNLRRSLSSFHIKNLELNLAEVEKNLADLKDKQGKLDNLASEIRLAEVERHLSDLKDKQGKLGNLASEIRLAEVEEQLADLEDKKKELKSLAENNLAPAKSLSKVNRKIQLLSKKRALIQESLPLEQERLNRQVQLMSKKRALIQESLPLEQERLNRQVQLLSKTRALIQESLPLKQELRNREARILDKKRKLIQERLPLERSLARQERACIKKRLGNPVLPGNIPEKGILSAPISGHIIWVNPNLREGAEMKSGVAFWIGKMDPMVIRARVHEIEVVRLKLGDMADFSTNSIPGRKFEAKVSRISWSTINPQLHLPSYYEVEFEVANSDFVLREGLRGLVTFRKNR